MNRFFRMTLAAVGVGAVSACLHAGDVISINFQGGGGSHGAIG